MFKKIGGTGGGPVPEFIGAACMFLLSGAILMACSGSQPAANTSSGDAGKTAQKNVDAVGSDDDMEDKEDVAASTKTKKAKAAKPALATEGKKTGVMEDVVIVQQQNEFLGASTLKLCKDGIRLESSTIIVLMPPGQQAIAYNPNNGNCMALTDKSRALLAGGAYGQEGKQTSKKLGTEKVAGLNCTHYKIIRTLVDPKSKKVVGGWASELWTTKDLNLPPSVIKDCARITMIPTDLGFPVKMTRTGSPTASEMRKGVKSGNRLREVVSTRSWTKAKLDKGQFGLLPGFKTVKDEMQLMMVSDDADADLAGGDLEDDAKTPVR